MCEERRPLLNGSTCPGEVVVDEDDADESPAFVFTDTTGNTFYIKCKVCQNLIELNIKQESHVVKCSRCMEATPIKPAPFGKKYVRCRCQCLLICKAGSRRVACPRENCKLIILLSSQDPQGFFPPSIVRVICAHCKQIFLFSIDNNNLARCPHCKKVSRVGSGKHRFKYFYLILGIFFLIIASLVTGFTFYLIKSNLGIIALYIVLYIVSVLLLSKFFYMVQLKISHIEIQPNTSA